MKGKNQTFKCLIIIQTQCYVNFRQVFPWLARKQSSPWDQPQNDIALWMAKTTTMLGPACTCISLNAIDQQSITIVWFVNLWSHPHIQPFKQSKWCPTNPQTISEESMLEKSNFQHAYWSTTCINCQSFDLPPPHEGTLECICIT